MESAPGSALKWSASPQNNRRRRRALLKQADVHPLPHLPTGILIRSLPLAQPFALPVPFFAPSNSGLRPRRQSECPLLRPQTSSRETLDREALDLRPAHQQAFHPQRMEQLRHRLTNVSPKGRPAGLIKIRSSAATLTTWKARPLLHPRYGLPVTIPRTVTSEKNLNDSRASPIKTPETRHDPHSSRLRPSVDGTFLLDKERISPHLQIRHSDYASGTAETQPV